MPKPYVRKMPASWWLRQPAYFYFMLREFTAVFVAIYCVTLLVMLSRLKQGSQAFQEFMDILQSPLSVGLHFVVFLFAAYHSITWFNLTPKVMVVRVGEEKVPPVLLVLSNYVAWILLSAALMYLVFGRR